MKFSVRKGRGGSINILPSAGTTSWIIRLRLQEPLQSCFASYVTGTICLWLLLVGIAVRTKRRNKKSRPPDGDPLFVSCPNNFKPLQIASKIFKNKLSVFFRRCSLKCHRTSVSVNTFETCKNQPSVPFRSLGNA